MKITEIQQKWPVVKKAVRRNSQMSDTAYNMWIRDLKIVDQQDSEDTVMIRIPSSNQREIPFYGRKFRQTIIDAVSEVTGANVKINFTVNEQNTDSADFWKLESLCWKGADDIYSGDIPSQTGERLARELLYVKRNRTLQQTLLTIRNFLTEFSLEPYQYSFRGTVGNSLIAHVLGFTDIDPVEYGLDERFFYGIDGENEEIRFEMNMAGANETEKITPFFTVIPGLYNVGLDCFCKATGVIPGTIIPYDPDIGDYLRRYPDMIGFGGNSVNPEGRRGILRWFKLKNIKTLANVDALTWGIGTWEGNGEKLVKEGTASVQDLPRTRDDVFQMLLLHRIDPDIAFGYAEDIGRGKGFPQDAARVLRDHDIPQWYIDSSNKVKYLLPRAHCLIYAEMQWRLAYYYLHFESRLNVKKEKNQ